MSDETLAVLDQQAIDHRRGDFEGEIVAITGFGPSGKLSVMLPPPASDRRLYGGCWLTVQCEGRF